MSSNGRSSNGFRPSYREATRNTVLPSGPHTQHFSPPAQATAPIPRKASVASSTLSSVSAASTAPSSSAVGAAGAQGSGFGQPALRRPSFDSGYVSSRSADALLSDVKPLTVDLVTLGLLNALLDEFLLTLVYAAGGLATAKLKTALPAVLPNPLARAAVEEAELELLSWLDSPDGAVWRGVGELPLGRGRDWNDAGGREGAGRDAGRLMRVMTQTYSTLGDRAPNDETELAYVQAFKAKGGDIRLGILESSALYLTAIIEYTAEYILTALGRVMGHGGQRLSSAGVQQFWDALSEDEALYEMLRGMKVRETVESTLDRIQARASRRQAKALARASAGTNTPTSTDPTSVSSPVPSTASTSSRNKIPFPATGAEGGAANPRDSSGGTSDASGAGRTSMDGPAGGANRGSLGAISEQRSRTTSLGVSAQSRPPPPASAGGILPGPNQRLSVESAASQASSVFSGRDGRDLRKSTSSSRPAKGRFESVLGFDPTGGEKSTRQTGAGNGVAGQDQREGMDEFEALLKGGSTKKMSLTPVVMKRTESSGSESSGPRQQQSPNLARTASDGSYKFGSAAGKRSPSTSSTLDGTGRPRDRTVSTEFARPPPAARSTSQGSVGSTTANGRLLARDPKSNKAIKEDEEDEGSEPDDFTPKKKTVRKESLAELLSSPPPWQQGSASPQALARPSPAKQPVAVGTPPSPPTSSHAFPSQVRSSSTSRASKQTKSSTSSPAATPPLPSTATFPAGPNAMKPVARSPKIDGDDNVDLGSDDEGASRNGTLKKKRATPASELISFLSDNQPPPKTTSPMTPGTSHTRNASSSPTPYLRLSPSVGSKLSIKETSSAGSSVAAPAEKPKEKKGFKGLMSKVLGKDSDHAAPSAGFDRRLISPPTAAPAGSVGSMRAASLEQPSRDLQDHAATVVFPRQPVKQPPPPPQQQQPAAASPASDFARPRTKSALSRGDQPPVAPFVRVRVTSQIDNGESYLPRDDLPTRSRTVSQISQSSASNTPTTSRPAPGVIPWLTGNDLGPQDRLKTPLRNMSISRKPVSPELRNAVDLPPEPVSPAVQTSPEQVESSNKTLPEQPSTVSSPPRAHQAPLATRLADVVARVGSAPVDRAPLPTINSPTQPQDSPALAASPPRTTSLPDGPRPDVSPASTITMKDEMPTLKTFPVPPVNGGESPSRIQKSLASAAAHAALAPPLPVFSAITPGASFDTPASPPTNGVEDKRSPALAASSSSSASASASATADDEPLTPKALREDTPKIRSQPFTSSAPAITATTSDAPASAASAPSIPVSDLVHLRSLLANASTADECRLLVNALLSLWKVPFPALPPSAPGSSLASDDTRAAEERARESQIARVFTWLLSEASAAPLPAAPPSYQGTPTIAQPPTAAEPPRPPTPGTPRVIPPTPVHPSDGHFSPASPSTATIDEDASVHSAEEIEEAAYEVRVVAGREAMFKATHRPNSPNGQHV